MAEKKPTIAELEALVSDSDVVVEILPDGRVQALGGTEEHAKNVILTWREELEGEY